MCNSTCLHKSVPVHDDLNKHITTSPKELVVYKPSKCINNNNVQCIACMYDYYDRPMGTAAEFHISSTDNQYYYISGSQYSLISCNHTFQGITIIANKSIPTLPFNYSMMIILYV